MCCTLLTLRPALYGWCSCRPRALLRYLLSPLERRLPPASLVDLHPLLLQLCLLAIRRLVARRPQVVLARQLQLVHQHPLLAQFLAALKHQLYLVRQHPLLAQQLVAQVQQRPLVA